MTQTPQVRKRRLLHTADWAFIVVVAATYLSFFTSKEVTFTPTEMLLLVGLGLVYVAIGTYVFEIYVFPATLKIKISYAVLQFALAIAISLVSRFAGAFWLILLPLVSHGAALFERIGTVIMSAVAMLIFGLLIGIPSGWRVGLAASLSFAPAVVFVVIFTQMAMSEARARDQIECLAQDLKHAHETLARYAVQAEELATAKERNRLAREIHDSLGHYLTAINVQLEAARALLQDDPAQAVPLLERAQTLTKEGLQEVRRSVAALRASPLEGQALPVVLEPLVAALQAGGIGATLVVEGAPRPLPPQLELALYRAAQEALTNVRKHAQAHHAVMTLRYTEGGVYLRVQDDGIGSATTSGGFGLIGLRERVQLLGGQLHLHSRPGAGFTLEIFLPEG